jgi:O-antigen ligase/tetratricopeptide (TPR) repeat protein
LRFAQTTRTLPDLFVTTHRKTLTDFVRQHLKRAPFMALKQTASTDALLLRCVDGLLAAALVGVPFLMGGRQAFGQLVLVGLAISAGCLWCLRQGLSDRGRWTWSWAEIVLAAALGLAGLQLLPVGPAAIQAISPRVYEILPLWSPETAPSARLGVWNCLSLTPTETRGVLILLTAMAILFLVTVQRIAAVDDVERLLRWVAIAGGLMAVFGLVQYVAGNGKFFWFYEHPFSKASDHIKGAFTNRNHFAHFIVLAIGPLVWWIQSSLQGPSSRLQPSHQAGFSRWTDSNIGFLVAALGGCIFAALMSLSRGGMAALFVSCAVILGLLYRASLLNIRTVLLLAGAGLLVFVGLGVYGYHMVADRVDDFGSIQELDELSMRRDLWRADLAAAREFRWVGTGGGSHAEVNPRYLPDTQANQGFQYTHAENGYLQVAMEAGLTGSLLLLAALTLVGSWCLPVLRPDVSRRVLLGYVGIVPGIVASLVHAMVDFVWYVPGCMVVVVVLAACACRLAQMTCQQQSPATCLPIPRLAWFAAVPTMLLVGWLAIPGLFGAMMAEPSWHRAWDQWRNVGSDDEAATRERLEAVAQELEQVVRWQPEHAMAHVRLAMTHLRLFHIAQGEGGLDARQVRDAAVQSAFASEADLQNWLQRAFGPSREHLLWAWQHARRAAELSPAHGETYLRLAELTFLAGPYAPDKNQCIQQALVLRPFGGAVLFEAGQEAMLANDPKAAFTFYRQAFQCGSGYQNLILRMLAGELPTSGFLELFPMDLRAMGSLEAEYRRLKRSEELQIALDVRGQMAMRDASQLQGPKAVQTWLSAAGAYGELRQPEACAWCLQQALRWEPSNYDVRQRLGTCLFEAQRYAEAEEHLNWCRQRKPTDEAVRSMLEKTVTERLRVTRRPPLAERN